MNLTDIKPYGNRILVKVDPGDIQINGIYMPETTNLKKQAGEVVAVSQTLKDPIAVGDRVQFAGYIGTEVQTDDGDKYLLMDVENILGVLT